MPTNTQPSGLNNEIQDSISTTVWHSDVSYELRPPGLTTFFLLSHLTTDGVTLIHVAGVYTEDTITAFLRTLSAVHSGVEQVGASSPSD